MPQLLMSNLKLFIKKLISTAFVKTILSIPFLRWVLSRTPIQFQMACLFGFTTPQKITIEIDDFTFPIYSSSKDDHFQKAFLGTIHKWEPESFSVWKALCANSETVLDVGAYLGIYSIVSVLAGTKQVVAYEPNRHAFHSLKENLKLNDIADRVISREVALSSVVGVANMIVPLNRNLSSGARLKSSETGIDFPHWENLDLVEIIPLDLDLQNMGIEKVDAIKIDVEGAELKVLQGAVNLISTQRPPIIIELLDYSTYLQVCSFLQSTGYGQPTPLDGISIALSNPGCRRSIATNYFFAKNSPEIA